MYRQSNMYNSEEADCIVLVKVHSSAKPKVKLEGKRRSVHTLGQGSVL